MNIQLVESLVKAIKSLSLEEQELLGKKLKDHPSCDVTEIIHQMREERDRQLMEEIVSE